MAADLLDPAGGTGDLRAGAMIGGCRIGRKLGEGGVGAVYKAHHQALDVPVAVKILSSRARQAGKEAVERFLREARSAARLDHPNIVRVLNVGEEGGRHFIVMQYVEGASLLEWIRRAGRLDPVRALKIGKGIAAALHAAHQAGIVHRDVKPANVLLSRTGQVKLADLGIAKVVAGDTAGLTATATAMGTPYYMAPEQARDARKADARSDLYALGATLYQMLTGRVPFDGETPYQIVLKHIEEPLVPPRAVDPSIPEGVSALVERLLAKDPAGRPESALAVAREIDALLGSLAPAGGKTEKVEAPAAPRGRRYAIAAGAAAAVLLVAILAAGPRRRDRRPRRESSPGEGGLPVTVAPRAPSFALRPAEAPAAPPAAAADRERALGILKGKPLWIFDAVPSPDGKILASAGADGVRLWSPEGAREAARLKGEGAAFSVAFSGDGKLLAAGGADGTVRRFDSGQDVMRGQVLAHRGPVLALAFSPDGGLLASGGRDGAIRLDALRGGGIRDILAHRGSVFCLAFSPDGKRLASGGRDRTIRLWDVEGGKELARGEGLPDFPVATDFSPDGRRVSAKLAGGALLGWTIEGPR